MYFPFENKKPNMISMQIAQREKSDEEFEDSIETVRKASRDERIEMGKNAAAYAIKQISILYDEDPQEMVEMLFLYIMTSCRLACSCLDSIQESRTKEVTEFVIEKIKDSMLEDPELYFDADKLNDIGYSNLVGFLCGSLQPFTSDHPFFLLSFMVCVACAGEVNEYGLIAIRELRREYIDFALAVSSGKISGEFNGTYKPDKYKAIKKINDGIVIETPECLIGSHGVDFRLYFE